MRHTKLPRGPRLRAASAEALAITAGVFLELIFAVSDGSSAFDVEKTKETFSAPLDITYGGRGAGPSGTRTGETGSGGANGTDTSGSRESNHIGSDDAASAVTVV